MKIEFDEIVFHDLPVEKVEFDESKQRLTIDILLNDELNDQYIPQRLEFLIIKMIQFDEVLLIENDELEICDFDYELRGNQLHGEFLCLLGIGKPTAIIQFISEIVT